MARPTVAGTAVEGSPYREAQSCLGPSFAQATYQFLLTGTSTPANVYQDGGLASPFPITGQVTADNYGRFPPIYLDTSVTYKVQLYDKTNTLKWTVDPYTPPLSTVGTSSLSAFGVTIAPTGELTVPAPNSGGSGVSLTLNPSVSGGAALRLVGTLAGNSALIVNNSATTGVRTATFTATNKPGTQASAPAGWLPITCDGVQYYTPVWRGNPFSPYVANPSAQGETIVAQSVLFGGNGLTTPTNGTATPSNWFSPVSGSIGAGYYIKITKTGGLSGLAFTAAQGAWTNIGAGGLTISSNAQAQITGSYQISTSITGTPVVATGAITLSGNNGVQQPTYNGATPAVFAGNGTTTFNGVAGSNWFAPTTANTGASYWINITRTGGSTGTSFSAAQGAWTNITNGGLTVGISGGTGTSFNVSGTYSIASDSGGVNVLGTGTITLTGSNVQSSNWSGTTPLALAGNGSATLNGSATSSWLSPNASNVGSGAWINITRTGGTTGVNFTAAQGSWTNITNSGLSIDISGYTGDVGTATATGTYQISNSSSGSPVLGSGTISLSISGLTVTRSYTSGTAATETVPTGTSTVVIEAWGGPGGGGGGNSTTCGGGGGSGGYSRSSYATSGGKTITFTVGAKGTGGAASTNGTAGTATTVGSGTQAITTMTANGGALGTAASGSTPGPGGAGGTASGGNQANTTGGAGGNGNNVGGGAAGTAPAGVNGSGNNGGVGGFQFNGGASGAGPGVVVFKYS